jgi:ribonuclease P protein component
VSGKIRIIVLRRRAEFLAAAKGRKWATPGLILQKNTPEQPDAAVIRYGLTASSKIGNAVTRNRARRRLRALALDILPRHAVPGHDYVLIARAVTPTREFKLLEDDLRSALKKLGAFHERGG